MNGTQLAAVGAPGPGSTASSVPTTDDLPTPRPALRLAPALPASPDPVVVALPEALGRPRRRGDLDEVWPCASGDFTPWLVRTVDVLGAAMGSRLTVVDTDVEADGFRYDFSALDGRGRLVVVTCQLEGTDLARLGDCLAAAAAVDAGAVVWVSRHLGDDIRHAFDWLNDRHDQPIRFFGVEADVALAGETGPYVPVLEVMASPADWEPDPTAPGTTRSWGVGESPVNRARQDLFRDVLLAVCTSRPSVPLPPRNIDSSWIDVAPGAFGCWSLAQVDDGRIRLEARLDTGDPARTATLFDLVAARADEWSHLAGADLAFERRGPRRPSRIAVHHPPVDLLRLTAAERDALVVRLVRTFVALHDTLDATLRGRAQLMRDAALTPRLRER